jgi:hypothetical protein
METQRHTMPAVRRLRVKGLKDRFRVTLYAKEGTYALSVPKSRLGYLLLPAARARPFEVRLKSAVQIDVPRGIKPVGKAARRSLTYTPLRSRKREQAAPPAPRIDEVTSAVVEPARRGKKRRAVGTAA